MSEHTITIVENPAFDNLTRDELLTAYDSRTAQIDILRSMWEKLSIEQTAILTHYHELESEEQS